jgi:hypothetical protein
MTLITTQVPSQFDTMMDQQAAGRSLSLGRETVTLLQSLGSLRLLPDALQLSLRSANV